MADNKKNVGKADRDRVDSKDRNEVRVVRKNTGVSGADVKNAAKKAGPMRKDIVKELARKK